MVVRWTFYDPIAVETWTVPINPSAYVEPAYRKTITSSATAAPDGGAIIFEGRDQVQEISFTGVALTQEHYDTFITWWNLRHQVKMTDDFGTELWIYITEVSATRKRAVTYTHKRDYEIKATVLSVAT